MKLTKNVKGRELQFVVTDHAYRQFSKRIRQITSGLMPNEIVARFVDNFRAANKLKKKSRTKQIRDGQYDGNPVYYRNKDFNFIVQENIIVTVEFNGNKKHMNCPKRKLAVSRGANY